MRFSLATILLFAAVESAASERSFFDRFFTQKTMRVDYFHTGTKGQETFSLDQVYEEGEWPGSRINLSDTLDLGEYLVRVNDRVTNLMIFSRGFSTIFNEWQTTDEATRGIHRTFSESVRLPYPKREIQLTISRRDKRMVFREVFSVMIDPNDPVQVNKTRRPARFKVRALMENGIPAEKVDILIMGDGYAKADMEKFRADAKRMNDALFHTQPFKGRKKDFNVWTIEVESNLSGIDTPDKGIWKGNSLGTHYNTFGSARYILTEDNKTVRDIAASAPYDFICILVNDTRYGGGGIYNLYATTYTKEVVSGQEWQMDYVYVHEFGHSFGGLGDEYYSSSVAYDDFYPRGVEPWEPNVTALLDRQNVKWNHFISENIDIPTPWEKSVFDSIETLRGKLDRLAPDYYQKREPLYQAAMGVLRGSMYAGKVGAFEGAGYATNGLFRPAVDCRMFSLSLADFDPVCSAALLRMIDFYSR